MKEILNYKLPFFNANKTIIAGPANPIAPTDTICPIICQLIIFLNPYYQFFNKILSNIITTNVNYNFT